MKDQTQIDPHIFREFSIRGIADRDLSNEIATRIGKATGTFFQQRGGKLLTVGKDVRTSSKRIARALIAGILQTGLDVYDVGVVPTPVLNFATDAYAAGGGIMVTASHNPPAYNGLKIRAENTLRGSELQEIYQLAQTAVAQEDTGVQPGKQRRIDPLPAYLQQVMDHAREPVFDGRPLKVVVDGGNGTNGRIVSQLLRDLGCDVVEQYCEPDGRFPNRRPDPTATAALTNLMAKVTAVNADVGVAYDGDGDRLVAVDEQGHVVLGDQLLMLLAREQLRHGPAKVVYEVLCTQAVADDVSAHGGTPLMTPSGYFFIQETMQAEKAALGGELSGHIFFNEPGFRFDDAILATVKLLNVLTGSQKPLSALVAALPTYESSPELRLSCPDAVKSSVVARVKQRYEKKYRVDAIDGARIHFPDGWALVRQSNTQPVISMRFEARQAASLQMIQQEVQSLVESYIEEASNPS